MLISILVSNVAEAYAADRLGSHRPRSLGKLTLNPLKHLDPFGSFILPLMLLFAGSPILFASGQGSGMHHSDFIRRRDFGFAALAPLVAKLLLMMIGMLIIRFAPTSSYLQIFALTFVWINFVFALIWMLPWPPFSLGRFIAGLLPKTIGDELLKIEPFGNYIFLGLILIGVLLPISPFSLWIQAFVPSLYSLLEVLGGQGAGEQLDIFFRSLL